MAVRTKRNPLLVTVLVAACQASTPSLQPESPSSPVGSVAPPTSTVASAKPPSPTPPAEHRIGIRTVDGRGEFFDRQTGKRFVPRGPNYLHLERDASGVVVDRLFADYDGAAAEADLRAMRDLGYSAVRIGLDICQDDCIGSTKGGLRADYLANIADFLRRASAVGLPVLIQANDLPEQGGFVPRVEATCCSPFDGYLNSQYLSPIGLGVFREYWTDVMEGLRDAGAPLDAVLAYELRGELFLTADTAPVNLRSGTVTAANGEAYDMSDTTARQRMIDEGIVYWIEEMAKVVRATDPNALVTVGEFAPNAPNDWRGKDPRIPPRIDVFLRTSVDFVDVHLYPGYIPIRGLLENVGVTGRESVPIVVGEYGAFKFAFGDPPTGAGGLMRWQTDACPFGLDGWFHWHWGGTGDAEVWTGSEGDGAINTVLSPRARPDPCATADFPFLRENLALGARTRASAALDGQGPDRAVDGDRGTGWVSGAQPRQWIEIDLGEPATIESLRLVVDQSPAGRTVHTISGGPSREKLERLHEFDGSTTYGDELTWTPPAPLTGIRVLRIETTRSPSWVAWLEIEVIGRRR
jgi:hypothetical protein